MLLLQRNQIAVHDCCIEQQHLLEKAWLAKYRYLPTSADICIASLFDLHLPCLEHRYCLRLTRKGSSRGEAGHLLHSLISSKSWLGLSVPPSSVSEPTSTPSPLCSSVHCFSFSFSVISGEPCLSISSVPLSSGWGRV